MNRVFLSFSAFCLLSLCQCATPLVDHTLDKADTVLEARLAQVDKITQDRIAQVDKSADQKVASLLLEVEGLKKEIKEILSSVDVQRKDTLDKINEISKRYEKIAEDYRILAETQSKAWQDTINLQSASWQKFLKEDVPVIVKESTAGAIKGLQDSLSPKKPDGSPLDGSSPWATIISGAVALAASYATHKISDAMKDKSGNKRWTEDQIKGVVQTHVDTLKAA